MVVDSKVRPANKVGKEAAAELNREPEAASPPRAIPMTPPPGRAAKAQKKAPRPRAKKSKLQFVVPAVVRWKLRHAAADEGVSVGDLLLRWIAEPLRQHDYPTMPEWLKSTDDPEGDSTLAA